MPIDAILAEIDAEIARLQKAKALLAASRNVAPNRNELQARAAPAKQRKKRHLSAEARARIAEAQKKRWAAQRAKAK